MMEGTVKFFNQKKGYGFITGDDGDDYFVHHSQLPTGIFPKENDKVSFEVKESEKGKQAENIQMLDE